MKEYKIPILWGSYRVYTVQAENLEEVVRNKVEYAQIEYLRRKERKLEIERGEII